MHLCENSYIECFYCGAPNKFTDKNVHFYGCQTFRDEKTKIDFTKPVRTKSGLAHVIYDAERHHGAVHHVNGGWYVACWSSDGTCMNHPGGDFDLVQEKEKRIIYKNLYRNESVLLVEDERLCLTRSEADLVDAARGHLYGERVACIRVELEEGRFDE